ncbi:vascular endothelial growth factor Ab isoform X3 [Engraulis encrasicolus]|uniref:vascular endothelial growth factor Ab isoform X3 n=1 Tax=Engraulis encrasicolus TaxID=184585 RepID=UPI002FD07A3F
MRVKLTEKPSKGTGQVRVSVGTVNHVLKTNLQTAHIPEDSGQRAHEALPMSFLEVFNRSMCRPREVLVDVLSEYPEEVEYLFIPSCVALTRCAGCCSDEALECTPILTHNVTLEVKRVRPLRQKTNSYMSFTEHSMCECRLKEVKTESPGVVCEPCCAGCSERRRRLFVQDPLTCLCSCKNTVAYCQGRGLELNERTCRCGEPRR